MRLNIGFNSNFEFINCINKEHFTFIIIIVSNKNVSTNNKIVFVSCTTQYKLKIITRFSMSLRVVYWI